MKVLAINGSPKTDKGNTALILNPFLDGMRTAGAEVELFYTRRLKINPCRGGLICQLKTPGVCFQKDDMKMLLPRMAEADIWVIGSPVYIDSFPGSVKNLMDRLPPLMQPFFHIRDGRSWRTVREWVKKGKIVLVSTCGAWEMDPFDLLLQQIKAGSRYVEREFAGALLRPHAQGLRAMWNAGFPLDDIIEAAREAGRQIVRDGHMSQETLDTVSRELMPQAAYVELVNQRIQLELDKLEQHPQSRA